MSKQLRKKRRRRVVINLVLLAFLLTSSLTLYGVLVQMENGQGPNLMTLWQQTDTEKIPAFKVGHQVMALKTAQSTADDAPLLPLKNEVALVISSKTMTIDGKQQIVYDLRYGQDKVMTNVREADLRAVDTPYKLGETVALVRGDERGETEDGVISRIQLTETDGKLHYLYTAAFPSIGQIEQLTEDDFVWIKPLAFREDNTAAQNNAILQQALDTAKTKKQARLTFPSGVFTIGSQTPDKDYIVLTSNVELRGQETTLVVDGSARWFGLPTGTQAQDGLSNFIMQGLTIQAKDLQKGNQFIIMANHGQNWQILDNHFIMVQQLSSHIFDLGGIQQATFSRNIFQGYAPELTDVTELGSYTLHNLISEAIQLDASSNNGQWDGGLIKAIDPNYQAFNPTSIMSDKITITDNHFIPYWSEDGQIVAYGASVGQHSSGVGQVTISNNVFQGTLSKRFRGKIDPSNDWLLEPIHLQSSAPNDISNNWISD